MISEIYCIIDWIYATGKLGFGHHGISSNYAIGGSVAAPCHIDIIYSEASLYINDKLILDKGKLLI